jgi:hypothetical protein
MVWSNDGILAGSVRFGIDDLTKSHDEAMVELEKKATEIQTYVDLKAQLESECVVGGAFWRMK